MPDKFSALKTVMAYMRNGSAGFDNIPAMEEDDILQSQVVAQALDDSVLQHCLLVSSTGLCW